MSRGSRFKRKIKPSILIISLMFLVGNKIYSQEKKFECSSIRTGIGIGVNDGHQETGLGLIYSIGWQKSYGAKNRFRLNPNMIIGGFKPIMITDTRDQFYRITSLGLNAHYDLVKYKAVSIVTTGGGFLNYSRGLLGTGGMAEANPEANNNHSEFFNSFYLGGNISLGLRIDPEDSKLAYEIRPLNIQFGNDYFLLGYLMFGIDIKLEKKNNEMPTIYIVHSRFCACTGVLHLPVFRCCIER